MRSAAKILNLFFDKLYYLRKYEVRLLFFVLLLLFFASCSKTKGQLQKNNKNLKTVVIKLALNTQRTIDPSQTLENSAVRIDRNIFEGLLIYDKSGLKLVSGIAKSYKISKDFKTYTFFLRKNLKWSDGHELSANQLILSWKRVFSPDSGSPFKQFFYSIKGVKDYSKGKIKNMKAVGLKAPDKTTLIITLEKPNHSLLQLLASTIFLPVPTHALKHNPHLFATLKALPVNGAFKITDEKKDQFIVLEKNKFYYDMENVKPDKIIVKFFRTGKAGYNLYASGSVDLMLGGIPIAFIKKLKQEKSRELIFEPTLCTYFLYLNCKSKNFNDPKIRSCFSSMIDREVLVWQTLGIGMTPAYNLIPPSLYENDKKALYKNNKKDKNSKNIPLDCKFPFKKINYIYNHSTGNRIVAQFIQRELQEKFGIKVSLNEFEWNMYLDELKKENFDVARGVWCADFPSPESFLTILESNNQNNASNFSNSQYDKTVEKLLQTEDIGERHKLIEISSQILSTQAPIVPIYHYTRVYLKKKNLIGFNPNPNGYHLWKNFSYAN